MSRSVYSVALCWRKPQIFAFFGLWHLVVSPTGSSLRKLNTGAQLQTFPYPNGIKIVSVLRLHSEIGHTNSEVQKRDGQTDKETNRQTNKQTDKKLYVFGRPYGR